MVVQFLGELYYVDGIKFPDPMSEQELIDCFIKYREGDLNSRDKIIYHNVKLVRAIVRRKFYMVDLEETDLSMVGIIGFMKCIDKFDISMGIKFSTYASRSIINEINVFLRKEIRHGNRELVDTNMITTEIDDDLAYRMREKQYLVVDDFVVQYEDYETVLEVREIVDSLDDKSREVVKMSYGFYDEKIYTQNEIAEVLGLTRGNVSMILHRALKEIKVKLAYLGIVGLPSKKGYVRKLERVI